VKLAQGVNKNSMFYWYPKVKDLGVPMPRTILIPFDRPYNFYSFYSEEEKPYLEKYISKIKQLHSSSGFGLPVFLRTDEASNKHAWTKSCYVTDIERIGNHIQNLLEFTAMVGIGVRGFVLREFLRLRVGFHAFRGMPISREFRFFVRNGEVECWHPYWPPAAIEDPDNSAFKVILNEFSRLRESELKVLAEYAEKLGGALGGYWSIDFCELQKGGWMMTDMAKGEDSYHWGTCKHAPKEMLEIYGDPLGRTTRKSIVDYFDGKELEGER